MRCVLVFVVAFLVIGQTQIEGRSARVSQLPNGSVNGCANCHVDPSGGGARTSFGDAINNGFLSAAGRSGTVVWNATLAGLDSDGDGVTNGTELGDPDGDGTPTAGAQVTNPGLASSFPQVTNNAPVLGTLSAQTIKEGATLTFAVSATDQDNDAVTVTAADLPTGAVFAEGNFTWTPGFDQSGSFTITFTATDGKDPVTGTVAITVENVARPLVINSFSPASSLLAASVGDTVRVSVVAESPEVGAVTYAWKVNGVDFAETNASLLFTVADANADDVIEVTVGDGSSSLKQSWTITKALKGDFNSDNVVDFSDFLSLVGAFGASSTDANFNAAVDIDGSGRVDFPDFLEFVKFFGLRL